MITNKSDWGPIIRDYIYLCCINYHSGNKDIFFMIMDGVLMSLPCEECYQHFSKYIESTAGDTLHDYYDTLRRAFNLQNNIRERQGIEQITYPEFKKYINSNFPSVPF